MSQPLDLGVTLTPPPAGSLPEVIASVALSCETLHLHHAGDLLEDPLTPQEREDLRWYLEEYPKWPFEGFLERGKRVERLLPTIGKRLFRAVFGNSEARHILQAWRKQPTQERQISIISDVPSVLSLPWELFHTGRGFVALRTRQPVSLVRRLPVGTSQPHTLPFTPPLRVLLVTARPKGPGFVDPRGIARELVDELQEQVEAGVIVLEFLRPATWEALRARLRDRKHPIHILHFDGHGMFDGQMGRQGRLAFEDERGYLDLVEARTLASLLQESSVPLVLLTACQSAMGADDDAFSSVAAQLIHQGIDAVVAMSTSVLVASATRYTEIFYRALARGAAVPLAHERARQQLQHDPRRHLLQRRLDEEGQLIELRDWWLPHFYQQRPVTFQLPPAERPRKRLSAKAPPLQRLNDKMPRSPGYGFTGRALELQEIERWLLQSKVVMITGFGGMGKTALAREAADWLTRTGLYSSACFISFEHGGDASTLLSALGQFLDVYDSHYNPQDLKAAMARLAPALRQHATLVIADNLESLQPGGEVPLSLEDRVALWETLLALSKLKAGVLLTSRDPQVGDGWLVEEKDVAHLPLSGLDAESAYLLASSLLDYLKIDRARVPYADLKELLKQLDYHPLAIQLVLPALRTRSPDIIFRQFYDLLPQFADDVATGRNRSLLASLQYSLERLSDAQRALLPCLALFAGGTREDNLLAITKIPESAWAQLRQELERVALLTREQVPGFTIPFLRFHPVLIPFLRSQLDAADRTLRERYIAHFSRLAAYLYDEDNRHPQAMRTLALLELPNLRCALDLLLEQDQREAATALADQIIRFLNIFQRLRERDNVRQRLVQTFKQQGASPDELLNYEEFIHQSGLGEDEFDLGNIRAAYMLFMTLLKRIEAQPEGTPLGPGSYQHCLTLTRLARCLIKAGQPAAAEVRLREAQVIIEVLLNQNPERQIFLQLQGGLLADMGDALRAQGRYPQARIAYEQSLHLASRQEDMRHQGVVLEQLGTVALEEHHYKEARKRYTEACALFHTLGEPTNEAVAWHQLGIVSEIQQDWDEAERCYRQSLTLKEQYGDLARAADTCHQLANVAHLAGRPAEAEAWYRRALELSEQVRPDSLEHAKHLNNLAYLLMEEVRACRSPRERLAEARHYAEQALAIKEQLDASAGAWATLNILAEIAEMEGQAEAARTYYRRERETYAAFAGNRYHIDRQHASLIDAVVAAARGNQQAREAVEQVFPDAEAQGWHITGPIQRIWKGERDWHVLAEGLSAEAALLILRILETLAQPPAEEAEEGPDREEIIRSFRPFITDVVAAARGNDQKRAKVEAGLPQIEENGWQISAAIRRIWAGERELQPLIAELDPNSALIIQHILETLAQPPAEAQEQPDDPLEQLIVAAAAAARGHAQAREAVEQALPMVEANGWHIAAPIQRIWAGERDTAALAAGLDQQDTLIVGRILDLLAQPPTEEEDAGGEDDDEVKQQRAFLEGFAVVVAAAAEGNQEARALAEEYLPQLEASGWRITAPIQHIWAGERDEAALVAGLDEQDTHLIQRILVLLAVQASSAEVRRRQTSD